MSDTTKDVQVSSSSSIHTLDLDDAFDDLDDVQIAPTFFTSDSIRQDIIAAHQLNASWGNDAQDDDPPDTNTSISTLDIGRRVLDLSEHSESSSIASRSVPILSPSASEDDVELELDSHFSTISLSEGPTAFSAAGDAERESSEQHSQRSDPHSEDQDDTTSAYPNIVIDASEDSISPSKRISYTHSNHYSDPQEMSYAAEPTNTETSPPTSAVATSSRSNPHLPTISRPSNDRDPHIPPITLSTSLPSASASASALPPPTSLSPVKDKFHRSTKSSAGPTALQKVVSRTRPSFLPPKSRGEDDKHLADWNAMMKLSRAAAEKRRLALQDRRNAREKRIQESLPHWEKEIVPDWTVVRRNPTLRRLWWSGIPTNLRATMWEQAVGNPLALNKDTYRTCLARAKRALSRQTFPTATLALIEADIETTLPALHIFHRETGPLYQDLHDMLCAWVVSRSDEGLGYTTGIAKIAAMVLLNMTPSSGFVAMRNLLERHLMRSFYGGEGSREDVEAYYRIFDTLLADGMPKIYFNFKQHQVSPASYLPTWLIPLFLDHLPFEACVRVWDVLILEGDSFLYRIALAILAVLEPRLFFPDRKELLELLRGENKAALDVARREGQRMDGGKYELYGVDEESLWERIDGMEEWWKESTWTRLIQRELPDL